MNEQTSAAAVAASQDVTGIRIVAGIIDAILLGVLFVIMSALFGDSDASSDDDGNGFSVSLSGLPFIIFLVLSFGYYFVLEAYNQGQTLGKKLMGIRVVPVEGVLTPGKVAIRTILRIVDGLPFLYIVGLIAIFASQRKQRIGDMAGGTLVVKA
jgi:uncharacterized RDD family membrane protein YckC